MPQDAETRAALVALLRACREALDCSNVDNVGDFNFGHRCVNCDNNVDRNMELRHAIDAALAQPVAGAETPAGTCATCRHWRRSPIDSHVGRGFCAVGVETSRAAATTEEHFGCTLHEPAAPPSTPERSAE